MAFPIPPRPGSLLRNLRPRFAQTPLLCLASLSLLAASPSATAQDKNARSGKEIFKVSCALCHGETGDGKGLVVFDPPARSFKQGAFSFGNTPEAVTRTVTAGIGGTPMPGFGAILPEAEIRAVAEYVISMGPKQPPAAGDASIVKVGKRPVVVRGQLPPVVEEAPMLPRGLMIGTLDGLSWQYAADDVRLLAVRQGAFVNRKDWGGRGGAPLRPLGKVMHLLEGGQPGPAFCMREDKRPLRAQLHSTRIDGGHAVIQMTLVDGAVKTVAAALNDATPKPQSGTNGKAVATVKEWGEAFSYNTAAGFTRHFTVSPADGNKRPDLFFRMDLPAKQSGNSELEMHDGNTWVWLQQNGRAIAIGMKVPGAFYMNEANHGRHILIPGGTGALDFEITTLLLPDDKVETWNKLKEEIY